MSTHALDDIPELDPTREAQRALAPALLNVPH